MSGGERCRWFVLRLTYVIRAEQKKGAR